MPKFSIIIPVYNTEKYLKKCLDSVLNQTFKDYEVIVVNDGSLDNSQSIIDKYNFKSYKKKNGGLSDARNYGVLKANGEYILFLDSDDYYAPNLLETLNNNLNDVDIIRFQAVRVSGDKTFDYLNTESFNTTNGNEAFIKLYQSKSIEPAPLYAYKRTYWLENNFKFSKDKYHEDFGLIPLVILKANTIKSIDFKGYYYVEREDSITTTTNYDKIKKKAFDMLYHFDYLYKNSNDNKLFNSFISNSLILKIKDLKASDKKEYTIELKKRNIINLILSDTLKRKIKKKILKLKYNL